MFDFIGFAMVAAIAEVDAMRKQEQAFQDSIKDLPPDVQKSMTQTRADAAEKRRLERIAERRHREMCDASAILAESFKG